MKRRHHITDQFINAVHRRMIIIGALEQLGLAVVIASAISTVLIAVAIYESMPTLPILIFGTLLAAVGGTLMAIYRWPARSLAASEADRQLELDDLLSTASTIAECRDQFATALLAIADSRCQRHSPSEVIFRKFGVRSWSAIALTMIAAVTLAAIPFNASNSQAGDANTTALSAPSSAPVVDMSTHTSRSITRTNEPDSENASRTSTQSDQQSDGTKDAPSSGGDRQNGGTSASGGGRANTAADSGNNSQVVGDSQRHSTETGSVGSGGGASATGKISGEHHDAAGGVGSSAAGEPAPAWIASNSSEVASDPGTPINIDRVPQVHRDLVRDFFSGK